MNYLAGVVFGLIAIFLTKLVFIRAEGALKGIWLPLIAGCVVFLVIVIVSGLRARALRGQGEPEE